MPVAVNW